MADPDFSNVVLLLPFDGSDGSTTFTDASDLANTVTAVGNAQLDTAQKKYGTAAGLFDGSGDYLSVADSADMELGSGDATIEGWVRFNALPSSGNSVAFVGKWGGASGTRSLIVGINNSGGTYRSKFTFSVNGVSVVDDFQTITTPVVGTWYHFAFVIESGVATHYWDGADVGSVSSVSFGNVAQPWNIGAANNGAFDPLNGWLDDIRLAKEAVYTAPFTPPTAAHPVSGISNQDIAIDQAEDTESALGFAIQAEAIIGQAGDLEAALNVTPLFDQLLMVGQAFDFERARLTAPQLALAQTASVAQVRELEAALSIDVVSDNQPFVYFEYEEHLDPIKKRGRAVLSRELLAGETISIERKTPITNEINFTEKTILNFNQVEYAFDKICFIEQEIEGSACDCRGASFVGIPSIEPPPSVTTGDPACQPYSCSAITDAYASLGLGGGWSSLVTFQGVWPWPFPLDNGFTNNAGSFGPVTGIENLAVPEEQPLPVDVCGAPQRLYLRVTGNPSTYHPTLNRLNDQRVYMVLGPYGLALDDTDSNSVIRWVSYFEYQYTNTNSNSPGQLFTNELGVYILFSSSDEDDDGVHDTLNINVLIPGEISQLVASISYDDIFDGSGTLWFPAMVGTSMSEPIFAAGSWTSTLTVNVGLGGLEQTFTFADVQIVGGTASIVDWATTDEDEIVLGTRPLTNLNGAQTVAVGGVGYAPDDLNFEQWRLTFNRNQKTYEIPASCSFDGDVI